MATTITGTEGVNLIKDGTVKQADLAANVVGNGPVVRANTSSQVIAGGASSATVAFSVEAADTNNAWDGSKFQPNVAGYYLIQTCITFIVSSTDGGERSSGIRINGTLIVGSNVRTARTDEIAVLPINTLVYLNGTTDFVTVTAFQSSVPSYALDGNAARNFFNAALVRAA